MGIFKRLLNLGNDEGIREAMTTAYQRHRRAAPADLGDTSPHKVGLYQALATRYAAAGNPIPEILIWLELTPFMALDETTALDALAEYVVLKEIPNRARLAFLTGAIRKGVEAAAKNEELQIQLEEAIAQGAFWTVLLDDDDPVIRQLMKT